MEFGLFLLCGVPHRAIVESEHHGHIKVDKESNYICAIVSYFLLFLF